MQNEGETLFHAHGWHTVHRCGHDPSLSLFLNRESVLEKVHAFGFLVVFGAFQHYIVTSNES